MYNLFFLLFLPSLSQNTLLGFALAAHASVAIAWHGSMLASTQLVIVTDVTIVLVVAVVPVIAVVDVCA